MNEEFLSYIWKYRLYSPDLHLVSGEPVDVVHPGDQNTDSGPDFFNSRVKIGTTLWAGNVEIHVAASDWYRHHHHTDHAYDSIILHVVYRNDLEAVSAAEKPLPTLELCRNINNETWQRYLRFMSSRNWIPCENLIPSVDRIYINSWLERLLIERLDRKAARVQEALTLLENDWNLAFFRLLARNMGFNLNNQAFEALAASLSYRQLARHSDNLMQLEAIVFGQAGMLNGNYSDSYAVALKKEYEFLRSKFSLSSMDGHLWKFMRLHPGNFPTLRLSQFAAIIHRSYGMLMDLLEINDLSVYSKAFNVSASEYWKDHYRFDKPAKPGNRRLGAEAVNLLVINLVAPFLFHYGKVKGDSAFIEKALEVLTGSKGEDNTHIRRWKALGMETCSASTTQALLELKGNYCDRKKCLSCRIGIALLKMD